jgi:glycosyltransferase involved in cell wall biosynthesis
VIHHSRIPPNDGSFFSAHCASKKAISGVTVKKLAILGTRGIPARYGGFETFAEQLATRLAARGVDVTVFCPSQSSKSTESFRGVTLRFVQFPDLGKYSEMVWDGRCFCEARRGYDVVYMLGLGGAYAAWVPRLFGAEVWVNTDGVEWKRTKFNWPQRAYLAVAEALSVLFATRVIADSGAIAAYLRRRYPGLKRVSTIAYGADIPAGKPNTKLIEECGLGPDAYYIVVCRLEPENHVVEAVEGFLQSNSHLPLVILGNIDKPNPYVQTLLTHRGDRIRFLGTVYDREKLAALRFFSRAYIHGHSVGGTNPSLLEAMACSNLVIAHDNPFNREVIGDCGLFFKTREQVAASVNAIDAMQIDAITIKQRAKERIRARYVWDQVADSYFTLLQAPL